MEQGVTAALSDRKTMLDRGPRGFHHILLDWIYRHKH